MKKCNRCKQDKPASEFGVCRGRSDGLQSKCIVCNREQARDYYHSAKQKDKHSERSCVRKKRIAEAIAAIKTAAGCRFCGERCSVCLDLHHVGNDKDFTIGGCAKAVKAIISEVAKCEVLCANCHRKIHAGLLIITSPRALDLKPLTRLADGTRYYNKFKSEE